MESVAVHLDHHGLIRPPAPVHQEVPPAPGVLTHHHRRLRDERPPGRLHVVVERGLRRSQPDDSIALLARVREVLKRLCMGRLVFLEVQAGGGFIDRGLLRSPAVGSSSPRSAAGPPSCGRLLAAAPNVNARSALSSSWA